MYNRALRSTSSADAPTREINFYGAALISEDGIEIPITEAMIEQALMQAECVGAAREHQAAN